MNEQEAHYFVYETLTKALGQNSNELKPAEEKLHEWEQIPGFYSILLNIFNNYSLDVNVRLLAVLHCKNGINKYWRSSAPSALSQDEKDYIRKGLLPQICDPVPQLSLQKALLISKIARYDWPEQWPGLVETLLERIEREGSREAAYALQHIFKTLSSKLLPADRANFADLTCKVTPVVTHYWILSASDAVQKFSINVEEAKKQLEYCYILLKIIEKLNCGPKLLKRVHNLDKFIEYLIPHMKTMLEIRLKTGTGGIVEKYCTRSMRLLAKIGRVLEAQFAPYIPASVSLVAWFAFTPDGTQVAYPLLLGHALTFIDNLLSGFPSDKRVSLTSSVSKFKWKSVKESGSTSEDSLRQTLNSVFDLETVCRIADTLIFHYFPLKKEDLELWESDPESLVEQWKEDWEGNVRKCAHKLLDKLLQLKHGEEIKNVIKRLSEAHPLHSDPTDLQAVLVIDAVYTAVMIACQSVHVRCEANMWYKTLANIDPVWESSGPGVLILKRRLALMLQLAIYFPETDNIFDHLVRLLGPSENLVVRLCAADSLKTIIDDYSLVLEVLEPYIDSTIAALLDLLCKVSQTDTKLRLLRVMISLVELVGVSINKHLGVFEHLMSSLWTEAEGTPLLQATLLNLLVALVRGIGKNIESRPFLLDMCFNAIAVGTDMTSDARVYLLDDSLQLCLALVSSICVASDQFKNRLLTIGTNLHNILENNTEFLKLWVLVIQAYTLLLPEPFLKSCGGSIVQTTAAQLHDLNNEGIDEILKMYELFIRVSPHLGITTLKPVLPKILRSIMVDELRNNVMAFSIFSRLVLFSTDSFFEILKEVCMGSCSIDDALDNIISRWCEFPTESISHERRKLRAIGLCSLLPLNLSVLYNKFAGIILAVSQTVDVISEKGEGGHLVDSLVLSTELEEWLAYDSDSEYSDCTANESRRRNLTLSDPIHTVSLMDYFKSQMTALLNIVGSANLADLIDTVDGETLQTFRYLKI